MHAGPEWLSLDETVTPPDLSRGLKAELVVMERKIEASLNPITNRVDISGEIPKDETGANTHSQSLQRHDRFADGDMDVDTRQSQLLRAPDEPRAAKDSFEERVVIARPSRGMPPPEKRGFKYLLKISDIFFADIL
jgi:hypothetical protein